MPRTAVVISSVHVLRAVSSWRLRERISSAGRPPRASCTRRNPLVGRVRRVTILGQKSSGLQPIATLSWFTAINRSRRQANWSEIRQGHGHAQFVGVRWITHYWTPQPSGQRNGEQSAGLGGGLEKATPTQRSAFFTAFGLLKGRGSMKDFIGMFHVCSFSLSGDRFPLFIQIPKLQIMS